MTEEHFSPDLKDEHDHSNQQSNLQAAGLKRPQDSIGGPAPKKSHIDNDDSVQVKVLIPSIAVGALIGKGGETMRNLKNETNCRVQMSKNQEVYHGTNERICMVKGKISQVMMVMDAISEKIREKVDPNAPGDSFDHKGVSRVKEMKLLMPNTSAGMVIGKSGASIKEIREATACQIQVFPKAGTNEAKSSLERVVTVAHDEIEMLMRAVLKVLEKVAADPQHDKPVDNKDTDNFHQVFGGGSGGSDFNRSNYGYGGQSQWAQSNNNYNMPANNFSNGGGFKYNPLQGCGNSELLSFLDSLQQTLRTSGFNEASVAEVMQAMQVLAKYNIMGLGLGLGVAAMAQMRQGGGVDVASIGGGDVGEVRLGGLSGGMQQQHQQQMPQQGGPTSGQGYAQTAGLTTGYYAGVNQQQGGGLGGMQVGGGMGGMMQSGGGGMQQQPMQGGMQGNIQGQNQYSSGPVSYQQSQPQLFGGGGSQQVGNQQFGGGQGVQQQFGGGGMQGQYGSGGQQQPQQQNFGTLQGGAGVTRVYITPH